MSETIIASYSAGAAGWPYPDFSEEGHFVFASEEGELSAASMDGEQYSLTLKDSFPSLTFRDYDQSSPATTSRVDMDEMRPFYSYVNEKEIEDFLARKPHMVEILRDLSGFLGRKYGVATSRVKHIADDYYDYDALEVMPIFRTKNREELGDIEEEIFYTFVCPLNLPFSESLLVAVRACDYD